MSSERRILDLWRPLDRPVPDGRLPAGVEVTGWDPAHARELHRLMAAAYRSGGGAVDPFDDWLEWFTGDDEFDPSSCFLAWSNGELVGVALCWSSAFVKDLCVAEHFRRRGLASSLLTLAMSHFRRRGADGLALRSHADNPSGANRLYAKLGFVERQS